MGQFGIGNVGLDGQAQVPRGHGRRHSVNVVNKPGQPGNGSISYSNPYGPQDGFDDGFAPPPGFGGHSRQVSRADSSWRISRLLFLLIDFS
jgi:protein SSD1